MWFQNYLDLLASEAFQHSLLNLVLYTVVFLAGTMIMGFLWAWMLDKPIKGEGIFRSIYRTLEQASSIFISTRRRAMLPAP